MKLGLNYAARSDQGRVRKSNQDSAYAGPHLLVIADGMGGPAGGDIASTVTVHELRKLDDDSFLAADMGDQLAAAIGVAHDHIVASSKRDSSLEGLGTTCTALIRSGDLLSLAHIGDSRAYRLRAGQLQQQTTDHSFVQYLIQQGQLTPEKAASHPQRSVLLRVLGDTQGRVELDRMTSSAQLGDRWLLCSDGLSGVVGADQLRDILSSYADPDAACEKLIEAALAAGGPDNITCVVADFIDEDEFEDLATDPITVGAAAAADERGTPLPPPTFDLPTAEIPTEDAPAGALGAQASAPNGYAGDAVQDAPGPLPASAAAAAGAPGQGAGAPPGAPTPTPEADAYPDPETAAPAKRRYRIWPALLALVLIAAVALGSWQWVVFMRQGWTLALESDHVTLYQGTPGKVGPVALYVKREILDEYTVVKDAEHCSEADTSKDPALFANPRAERVLSCAAMRRLGATVDQPSDEDAHAWLDRNSRALVVNTEAGAQTLPPAGDNPTTSATPGTETPSPTPAAPASPSATEKTP